MVTTLPITVSLDGAVTCTNSPTAAVCLVDAGIGDVGRRRQVITSPWTAGEIELASVADARTYALTVRCQGSTWSAASSAVASVLATVRQRTWTLTETIDGVTATYSCYAATTSLPRDGVDRINRSQIVVITIPLAQ